MDLLLTDRVALVTGAGSGIGASIAGTLAREGCVVQVADLRLESAQKVEKNLKEEGRKVFSIQMDIGDAKRVDRVVRQVVDDQGRIDILVNNAGSLKTDTIMNSSVEDWEEVSKVNLSGVFYCSKAVLPFMLKEKYGKIVNIASVSAMKGGGALGNALYGTTKAGVVAMTKGLARELAPSGINVNAIAPAVVETFMTNSKLTPELRGKIREKIPMGRLGKASDVASLAAFLASDVAGYITGETIVVDGGYLVG
jgi:NAD(P)-dependent dehydrogenase (short-subunit alcohol dehydrogenase family)